MGAYKEEYDKTMLYCLKVTGFRKTKAIQLFQQQFPNMEWMKPYSYKIYERVMENLNTQPEMQKLINELVCNLRSAAEATLEQGLEFKNWEPFEKMASLILRASGLEKNQTNVTMNTNVLSMSRPPEDIAKRIAELEQSIGNRLPPAIGGVQPAVIGQPVVEVQAS